MNIDFQKKKTSLFFFNKGKDKDLWVSCLQQSYSPLQAVAFFFPQQRYSDPTIWLPFFILSYFSMLPIKVNLGSKSVSCNLWFIFILTEFDLICTHDPIQPTQWNNMDLFFYIKDSEGRFIICFSRQTLCLAHTASWSLTQIEFDIADDQELKRYSTILLCQTKETRT